MLIGDNGFVTGRIELGGDRVSLADIANYPWLLLELALVGFLVFELVKTRRSIRRDREEAKKREQAERDSATDGA